MESPGRNPDCLGGQEIVFLQMFVNFAKYYFFKQLATDW